MDPLWYTSMTSIVALHKTPATTLLACEDVILLISALHTKHDLFSAKCQCRFSPICHAMPKALQHHCHIRSSQKIYVR